MTITAKFAGRCATCGQTVLPGERIEWSRGTPVRHTQCPTGHVHAAAPRPRPTVCVKCHGSLSTWERQHGIRCCADCRDGGSRARGGMSYYDRNGNFVLGDDD